jgi:acyl carrier protein
VNESEARATIATVLRQIAPEIALDDVDVEAPLRDEFDLDSMDFLNLVVGIHEATALDIPESDYPQVATLRGFVEYLVARTG